MTEPETTDELPGLIGSCGECEFTIHREGVEERVQILAQEGQNVDIGDVALSDAETHARVCSGSIEWADEWDIPE